MDLGEQVPSEIRDMFHVARGILPYGWFFYPLYRVGEEQLHRVCDAAAASRYRQIGGPLNHEGKHPSFHGRIGYLVKHGVITDEYEQLWDYFRDARNQGSHAHFQSAHPPGRSAESLREAAEAITSLFDIEPTDLS